MADRRRNLRGRPARRAAERGARIPTGDKIALVDCLSAAGFRRIEVASFVSPRMGAADGGFGRGAGRYHPRARRAYAALTPNMRGSSARAARRRRGGDLRLGLRRVLEGQHQRHDRREPRAFRAGGRGGAGGAGCRCAAMSPACATAPMTGRWRPAQVARVAESLDSRWAATRSASATPSGRATPERIDAMLAAVRCRARRRGWRALPRHRRARARQYRGVAGARAAGVRRRRGRAWVAAPTRQARPATWPPKRCMPGWRAGLRPASMRQRLTGGGIWRARCAASDRNLEKISAGAFQEISGEEEMMAETIDIERDARGVATLWLDRADKHNALSAADDRRAARRRAGAGRR